MRSRARESEAMVELVKGGKYAWFVLTILGAIYVQNQWSRYSLNYMYAVSADDDKESIRAATDLNGMEGEVASRADDLDGTYISANLEIRVAFAVPEDPKGKTFIAHLKEDEVEAL